MTPPPEQRLLSSSLARSKPHVCDTQGVQTGCPAFLRVGCQHLEARPAEKTAINYLSRQRAAREHQSKEVKKRSTRTDRIAARLAIHTG